MTINIIFNNSSNLAPKVGARRTAFRWYEKLVGAGLNVTMRAFNGLEDIQELALLDIDMHSEVEPGELCYLVIYDDTRKGKFITNESEDLNLQDMLGYFKPKKERRLEMTMILNKLNFGIEY